MFPAAKVFDWILHKNQMNNYPTFGYGYGIARLAKMNPIDSFRFARNGRKHPPHYGHSWDYSV